MSSVLNRNSSSNIPQNSSSISNSSIADFIKNSNNCSNSNVFYENIYDIKKLENIKPDKILLDQIKYSKLVEILTCEIRAIPEYSKYKLDTFVIHLLLQKSQILTEDDANDAKDVNINDALLDSLKIVYQLSPDELRIANTMIRFIISKQQKTSDNFFFRAIKYLKKIIF